MPHPMSRFSRRPRPVCDQIVTDSGSFLITPAHSVRPALSGSQRPTAVPRRGVVGAGVLISPLSEFRVLPPPPLTQGLRGAPIRATPIDDRGDERIGEGHEDEGRGERTW